MERRLIAAATSLLPARFCCQEPLIRGDRLGGGLFGEVFTTWRTSAIPVTDSCDLSNIISSQSSGNISHPVCFDLLLAAVNTLQIFKHLCQ